MELLVEAALADGRNEIQLEVRGDNSYAIEFYKKRGFRDCFNPRGILSKQVLVT